jgi:hypothetical protein
MKASWSRQRCMTTTAPRPLPPVPGWTAVAGATSPLLLAHRPDRGRTVRWKPAPSYALRWSSGQPHAVHDDLIQAVKVAKLKGDSLLDKEDSLMARLPLSGDIGIFIVDAEYNALQARSISDAEQYAREKAWAYLAACQTMPGWENAYLSVTGPILGTRESRHVDAAYQLTAEDITSGRHFEDVVAQGAWAMEYHDVAGAESTWIPVKDKGAYDIPLRTLTSVDTPNLYAAGRAADGDQYAGGSLRVMGTAFATGHAAGVAAALQASAGKPIPAAQVQQELQRQDARLPGP